MTNTTVRALCAMLLGALAAGPAAGSGLQSTAALARELGATGRAEAALRYVVATPGSAARAVHATLALEPPERARIDVTATGEKLVARGDGGEWLQPSTRQLLRFRREQAAPALRWWRALLAPATATRERRIGEGRWVVTLVGERGMPQDSAEVWVDPRGLPTRLVVPAGDPGAAVYRLGGWRFMRPRGDAAFRLRAPAGYDTVDTP